MKTLALIAVLASLSSTTHAYHERIDRSDDGAKASWFAPAGAMTAGAEPAEFGPIANNFYAFSGDFASKDLTCDQFIGKIHELISDWKAYPHMNFYALSNCSGQRGGPSETH